MQDSHAQIWKELAALYEEDQTLFQGKNGPIQDEMLDILGHSEATFPIRRLVTLWKAKGWRELITRWCKTPLGDSLFQLSLWEELSRCRIDDVSYFSEWVFLS